MPRHPMTAGSVSSLMQELSVAAIVRIVSGELVETALRETAKASKRNRLLPAPMVVYLAASLALYSEASVGENLRMLLEPLRRRFGRENTKAPGDSAISQARQRLGPEPMAWLFEQIARPIGEADLPGCFWRGRRVVAADATSVDLQDTEANRARFGVHSNQHGEVGYPQLKLVLLAECGTRAPLGCAYGPNNACEEKLFDPLQDRLAPDMLFLADRAYYDFARWKSCAERAAGLLWRVKKSLLLKPVRTFDDGSFLAEIRPSSKLTRDGRAARGDKLTVRVIEYRPVFEDGSEGETVRLITTLLSPDEAPADELGRLYSERWSMETGFDELKTHLRGPHRVLRSQLPELVEQELYGFLLTYYVVRATMCEAARRARAAPRRLSFVHSVRVIRRQVAFFPDGRRPHEPSV